MLVKKITFGVLGIKKITTGESVGTNLHNTIKIGKRGGVKLFLKEFGKILG